MLDATTQTPDVTEDGMTVPADALKRVGKGVLKDGRRALRLWLASQGEARPVNGPTAKPGDVRAAVPADEAALLELMLLDVKENALDIAAPCPEKIMEHIRMGTQRKGAVLGVIDGPDGKPVACINLAFFQWWWSRAYFLQEVWAFVHPAHRKSNHAMHLAQFARWCSDDMTSGFGYRVWLLSGVTSKENVEKKVAFYGRNGNYIGAFFIYPDPKGSVP